MANDPGLAGDTCIFMESVSGDGGVNNNSGVWWMSPDIVLTRQTPGKSILLKSRFTAKT
jgi:hypothetical protein